MFGMLDDIAVLAWLMKALDDELTAFRPWRTRQHPEKLGSRAPARYARAIGASGPEKILNPMRLIHRETPRDLVDCYYYTSKDYADRLLLLSYGVVMGIQVITRDGEPEYAVLPWAQYQALLKAAGVKEQPPREPPVPHAATPDPVLPGLDHLRIYAKNRALPSSLARTVGIIPSYLAMIESGERVPDAAIRRSLAWELRVPGWRD